MAIDGIQTPGPRPIELGNNGGTQIRINEDSSVSIPALSTAYDNTIIVAKTGTTYSTIQSAIDSITDATADKRYAILVYPGVYEEQIVMKNYVSLMGVDGRRGAKIKAPTGGGTLITMPTIEAHINSIDLEMAAENSSDTIIDATAGAGSTGFYRVENSDITLTSADEIVPKILDTNVGVGLYLISTTVTYTLTSTTTGGGTAIPLNIQAGNELFYFLRSTMFASIASPNINLVGINDLSSGKILIDSVIMEVETTNAAWAGQCLAIAVYGGGSGHGLKRLSNSIIKAVGYGSGTGYAVTHTPGGGGGELNVFGNFFDVSGFPTNFRYNASVSSTIYSHANRSDPAISDAPGSETRVYSVDVTGGGDLALIMSKMGIGIKTPSWKQQILETRNAISGTNVDISELSMVMSKGQDTDNEAVGLGFGCSSSLNSVGAAIIHERVGGASQGGIHFATKPDTGVATDLPICVTMDKDGKTGVGTTTPTALLDVDSDIIRLRQSKTPASASAAGNAGDIAWDSDYLYVCVATNTWKRVGIATW